MYDEPHKDYLYTPAWVEHLIEKMEIEGEYESLYEKKWRDNSLAGTSEAVMQAAPRRANGPRRRRRSGSGCGRGARRAP